MRALLDANIFISHLLSPQHRSPINDVIRAGLLGKFVLLLPEELIQELSRKVSSKPYLAQRISAEEVAELVAILSEVAEVLPRIAEQIPAVTRDPKDDYLLAHALVGQADYLVSGDGDLLALDQVEHTKIVSVREFWEILEAAGEV